MGSQLPWSSEAKSSPQQLKIYPPRELVGDDPTKQDTKSCHLLVREWKAVDFTDSNADSKIEATDKFLFKRLSSTMPSPFPGMNPYLEHPELWSTVHNRLIVALADFLTPQLLPKYQVDIEKRVYEVVGVNSILGGRPDVTVQRPRSPDSAMPTNIVVSASPIEPVKVTVPMMEEVREAYLEIKEAATQIVVTAIEILSPTNKRGEGRQKYEQKRQQVLNSRTHFVEIDLLRDGEPLPIVGNKVSSSYRILLSCSNTRPMADLYPFDLADSIPLFPIPLQPRDEEPVVNLQTLLNEIYERSGYDYFIDYCSDPLPPISETELAWTDFLLKEKGLR